MRFCAGMVLVAILLGCGGDPQDPRVSVTGKVTNDGKPLEVKRMVGRVQVTFIRVTNPGDPPTDPQEAVVQPDGSFTVPGTDDKGIPPGKYKIAVRQWDEFPTKDTLEGRFSAEQTPIVKDVDGKSPIDIDVSKPTG